MRKIFRVRDAHLPIKAREAFVAGNMEGVVIADPTQYERYPLLHRPYGIGFVVARDAGYLDKCWVDRFNRDLPTYVVWSYGTPIFWVASDGREVYPVRTYSATTSQHQMQVRRAMSWNPLMKLREPADYELAV